MLKRDLPFRVYTTYKQDSKLAAAINNLCKRETAQIDITQTITLPERKLQFNEVQDLLKQSSKAQGS